MSPLEILRRSFRAIAIPTESPRWPDYPLLCGVYLLIGDGEIVYVGSSANVLGRIWTHRRNKAFGEALWVRLPAAVHLHYEGAFIRALRPRLNRSAPIDARYDSEILEGFGLEPCLEWWAPPAAEPAPLSDIALRIARWRVARMMSQTELASKIGVSRACVSLWETGKTKPTIANIQLVAEAVGTDMFGFYK